MNTMTIRHIASPNSKIIHRQKGAILVTALILLLVMTLIGVTALQTTTLEERMAGASEDINRAFQAAEAALREGEGSLEAAVLDTFDGTVLGLYEPNPDDQDPLWEIPNTWTDGSIDYNTGGQSLSNVADQPKYIIEELDPISESGSSKNSDMALEDSGFYRITSRATGANDNVVVILQSTYKR